MLIPLPTAWQAFLGPSPLPETLVQFLEAEYAQHTIYPPQHQLFEALNLTSPEQVKVVILGQDPYHNAGQAHGLAFSVNPGVALPPSLRNLFQELQSDLGCEMPEQGDLRAWAKQGVLLLNTVLTVRAHEAASHQKRGWEAFTDQIIQAVSKNHDHVVFILWGKAAQAKQKIIASRHTLLCSVHPSPLSAYRGFFGSRPFSQANAALLAHHQTPIAWCLSGVQA